jgi:hypothetical protein
MGSDDWSPSKNRMRWNPCKLEAMVSTLFPGSSTPRIVGEISLRCKERAVHSNEGRSFWPLFQFHCIHLDSAAPFLASQRFFSAESGLRGIYIQCSDCLGPTICRRIEIRCDKRPHGTNDGMVNCVNRLGIIEHGLGGFLLFRCIAALDGTHEWDDG